MVIVRTRRTLAAACVAIALLAALVAACGGDSAPSPDRERDELPAPTRTASDALTDKMSLWDASTGPHLRGADLHPCWLDSAGTCAQLTNRQDVQDLRGLGANLVNASYPGVFSELPPYEADSTTLAYLDNLIGWAEDIGLYVVIHFRTGPGRNEAAIVGADDPLHTVWTDEAAHKAWIDMWRFTAERYSDSPIVIGYDLMVEPHVNTLIDPEGEMDPVDVQAQTEGTLQDWNAFAAEIAAAIREVDSETPIIVNSLNWADAAWFPALQPTGDPRTIYSLHAYNPGVYTNQDFEPGDEFEISYPDIVDDEGESITFDRAWLEEDLQPVVEFSRENGVPIYVGEFGTMRWVPGAVDFHRDQTALFEEYGWNYAYYTWRADTADWDGFNLEYGPDPENHSPITDNSLLAVHRGRWAQNLAFPADSEPHPAGASSLADVRHWLYLIDVNLVPETVALIADSAHDMVVLDFIPSEVNNTDYPMADVVTELHDAAHPKLVVAYIDIGEAEDYRTYWREGWSVGDPEWIAGADPDGWEGNFPVAFWHDDWQDIWLGHGGYLQDILDAGFDGVYLDWVEAYSDDNVVRVAERDGVDPVEEIISWVGDIATFGRLERPGFIVIGQNAAELAEHDDYADVIDAIAQEQVWFDGGADNDPPGDCPLPRTDDDVDTDEYLTSLSEPCRRYVESEPDSPLHVSTDEYLGQLSLAQSKGQTILTVDYALQPENVAWVFATSRSLGFIPFVGNRALDRYLDPVP